MCEQLTGGYFTLRMAPNILKFIIIKSFRLWLCYGKWKFCVLFSLLYFHTFYFWDSLKVFDSHVCLLNSTLNCGITTLIISLILNLRITSTIILLSVKVASLKNTLKPKLSFYFSSVLYKFIKHIIM